MSRFQPSYFSITKAFNIFSFDCAWPSTLPLNPFSFSTRIIITLWFWFFLATRFPSVACFLLIVTVPGFTIIHLLNERRDFVFNRFYIECRNKFNIAFVFRKETPLSQPIKCKTKTNHALVTCNTETNHAVVTCIFLLLRQFPYLGCEFVLLHAIFSFKYILIRN